MDNVLLPSLLITPQQFESGATKSQANVKRPVVATPTGQAD